MSEIRAQLMDFSDTLYKDEQILAYRRPVYEPDILGFLKPYTTLVSGLYYILFHLSI